MTDKTALGDRMKVHENVTRMVLPKRTYTILRCDGRSFSRYLKRCDKPFDYNLMECMNATAAKLCEAVEGSVFAFTCSDEISLLLSDFGSVHAQPWFGGVVQKMTSVAAALTSAHFAWQAENSVHALGSKLPHFMPAFDARVFTIADPVEVANYFVWRQRDCTRNSISMAAQAHFPHGRLQGCSGAQLQEMLWSEKGTNWNDYPDGARRGRIAVKEETEVAGNPLYDDEATVLRSRWTAREAPRFEAVPGNFLAGIIPPAPDLKEKNVTE